MVSGQDLFSTLRIKQYGWLNVIVPLMSYMVEMHLRQGRVIHHRLLQTRLGYVSDERGCTRRPVVELP
jgi:hypothetical protein